MGELEKNDYSKVTKDLIPLLVTATGEVLCLDKNRDPEKFGSVGSSRTGKTLALTSLLCGKYGIHKERCIIGNDYTNESLAWSEPAKNKLFEYMLQCFSLNTAALPIVYVYPNFKNLVIPEGIKEKIKISLSYTYFIRNLLKFFDLKDSGEYYDSLISELENTTDLVEIKNVINKLPNNLSATKGMLFNKISYALNNHLLDINTDDTVSEILAEKGYKGSDSPMRQEITRKRMRPISALLYANLIPSIMRYQMKQQYQEFADIYVDNVFRQIIDERMNTDGWFWKKKMKINFFLDELTTLCVGKKTIPSLIDIANIGGPIGLSLYYATQHYHQIPEDIRGNTKYIIVFNTHDKSASELCSDFGLSSKWKKEIKKLRKENRECIAITTENFVSLKIENGKIKREKVGQEPIKGVLVPPMCRTLRPDEIFEPSQLLNYPASDILRQRNILLSSNEKRILNLRSLGSPSFISPQIIIKERTLELMRKYYIERKKDNFFLDKLSYEELKRNGIYIYSRIVKAYDGLFADTKKVYSVVYEEELEDEKKELRTKVESEIPEELIIRFDPFQKRIMLQGKDTEYYLGDTWFYLDYHKQTGVEKSEN